MPGSEQHGSRPVGPGSLLPGRYCSAVHAALLLLGALCGCEKAVPPRDFQVVMENGAPAAVARGGPLWTERLSEYDFDLYLQEDHRGASKLQVPDGFARGERGGFRVSNEGNGRMAVFDPGGRYIRSIGRSGRGSGELEWMDDPWTGAWMDTHLKVLEDLPGAGALDLPRLCVYSLRPRVSGLDYP